MRDTSSTAKKCEKRAPDLAEKSSKKVDDIISTMSQSSVSAACTSADATITNLAATAAHFRNPDGLRQDIPSAFLSPLPPYLRSAALVLYLVVPRTFYLTPMVVVMSPVLYMYLPTLAAFLLVIYVSLMTFPLCLWPAF